MSDNPLESSPERDALIETRAKELMQAAGNTGNLDDFRERADELVRMEQAGATGQLPIDAPDFVEEAALQQNLGEFPGSAGGADQGENRETPMTDDEMKSEPDVA